MAKLGHVIEANMIHEYARVPVIPTIYGRSHNKAILQMNYPAAEMRGIIGLNKNFYNKGYQEMQILMS